MSSPRRAVVIGRITLALSVLAGVPAAHAQIVVFPTPAPSPSTTPVVKPRPWLCGFGCVRPTYVKASNPHHSQQFGSAVALSRDGRTFAVGAPGDASSATGIDGDQTSRTAQGSGAVHVFVRDGSTWTQQAYVKASNAEMSDRFGSSVALSADGNTLAVGAHREASAATGIGGDEADNSAAWAGAVYVFRRSAKSPSFGPPPRWTQVAYVKASNTDDHDLFGYSVSLSADGATLAVSAPREQSRATGIDGDQANNDWSGAGAVYVFTETGGTWTQQAYVKASNTSDDSFGWSTAISADGHTLAVGSTGEDSSATGIGGDQSDDSALNSGAVYVFTRAAGTWSQQAYVKASNTGERDNFGSSVALDADGNVMAVGAIREASAATGIGGNQSDDSTAASGAVYVFTKTAGTWRQSEYVKASNTGADDKFGSSVALGSDGATLAVGAQYEDSGAAYVFIRSGGSWIQKNYVKATNPGFWYHFGGAVSLSGSGYTLLVGANMESGDSIGVDGPPTGTPAAFSGSAYVYYGF